MMVVHLIDRRHLKKTAPRTEFYWTPRVASLMASLCRLEWCCITDEGCTALASALLSSPSSLLKNLYLYVNELGESGQEPLCNLLKDSNSKLEKLE